MRKRTKIKVRKRHFLLLEVIIAFILIVMCIIPLISPHTFILTEQKRFVHTIEVDHLVNLAFADIVKRMYINDINWSRIVNRDIFEVDESLLQRVEYKKQLPYTGVYRFGVVRYKPTGESPRKLYLLKLEMKFIPKGKTLTSFEEKMPGVLSYYYELFAVRDLGEGNLPEVEEEDSSEEDTQTI